ncbi:beta-glycosyltransferase/ family 2 [Synechococcus sp. Minos11]|uniref:glycosyltransferase family 2 protein n=1 Tax=Synechococcus sp. Minos11 TaxID=221341 RepID=UPI000EE3EB0C|nr:glycosyltransferase family 2 protein [Synechococcus sp. Minos11]QNJ07917.1 beta-glycosyltransferase/ family 2 [Synechococcus sp. Minos11]HCA61882.1 glycosyltransferase [Synechococcales bacterium UBA8647]|tara:strand:- start:1406 stop:2362 length:957 start_codon:yes stop_codon:yes gene_type:complete
MNTTNNQLWAIACCFNEEAGITTFIEAVLAQPSVDRLLLIDDGSRDNTTGAIRQWMEAQPQAPITLVELTRNFGKEAAMLAGLDQAVGRCGAVIQIDSDLQHPPELIAEMVQHWHAGAEMVTAVRDERDQESRLKILSASGFYRLFNRMVDSIELTDGAGDYRLLSAPVVQALTELRENDRFSKGLYPWTGFRSVNIPYLRPPRSSGTSAWNPRRLWLYALDGIFSFSVLPLKVWTLLGLVISLLSLIYAFYRLTITLVFGIDVPGWTTLVVAILFLGGVQLIGIGILGEYVGRIYMESKRRPAYFVRDIHPAPDSKA